MVLLLCPIKVQQIIFCLVHANVNSHFQLLISSYGGEGVLHLVLYLVLLWHGGCLRSLDYHY